MPVYEPLTDIIPTPATGVVVPAAWGDQVDDNLVNNYEGTWFRAIGGATTLVAAAFTTIAMTSISTSATATDEGTISIVSGSVQVTKPGFWLLMACVLFGATSNNSLIAITATDSAGTYQTVGGTNTTSSNTIHETSGIAVVTSSPALFAVKCYILTTTPTVTVNNYSPRLNGLWLGETP